MKITLAQINPTLGDFKSNTDLILKHIQKAVLESSDLVVFPECSLFGYYPADLLERESVIKEQLKYINLIKKNMPKDISALVGCITINEDKQGKLFKNSAVLLNKNKATQVFHKTLLPTYDIFDERRHFEPGDIKKNFFTLKGKKILVTICEDIWGWNIYGRILYAKNPILDVQKKCDLIVNLSASPYTLSKVNYRKKVVAQTTQRLNAPMIYVNQFGAQDETVFDGGSLVANAKGEVVHQIVGLKEEQLTVDLDHISKKKKTTLKKAKPLDVLTLGIEDFFRKTGFKKAHLGLSGGMDSALVYVLACRALGAESVEAIAMPTKFNASISESLARQLCKNFNKELHVFPIQNIFQTFSDETLKHFNTSEFSSVHENLQARIRADILMAYSNLNHSMLLATSNKTEMAVGYTTLYGDMCGGLAPIGDLTKTQVYELAEEINKDSEIIPRQIITRPPSAELRPNQKDQDSLPDYASLDKAVVKIVQKTAKPSTAVEKWTLEALMKSEFKRWQAPPILKITDHAFGRGRRFPIAHKALI